MVGLLEQYRQMLVTADLVPRVETLEEQKKNADEGL
jgi:hypothetical protein